MKPVTVNPAIVVLPEKVAGPETLRVERVEVAADSEPENVPLLNAELPCNTQVAGEVFRARAEGVS